MRPLKSLLLLVCSTFFSAGSAGAVVYSHGVAHFPDGGAVVTGSPDQQTLYLSNLDDSGNDGMTVQLSHLDGYQLSCAQSFSSSDDGVVLRFAWDAASDLLVLGKPAGPRTSTLIEYVLLCGLVAIPASSPAAHLTIDLSGGGATSSVMTLYSNSVVVYQRTTLSSSATLDVQCASGSSCPIPSPKLVLDRESGRVSMSIDCRAPSQVVVDGVPHDCDRIVLEADTDGDGQLEQCSLRCTIPSGSSLSSLTVDGESVTRFSHSMSTIGQVHLIGSPEYLTIDNFSSSVEGGLSLQRSDLQGQLNEQKGSLLRFSSLTLDPVADDGASLSTRVTGSGGTCTSSCASGYCLASLRSTMVSGSLLLETDFSGMCAEDESVYVYNGGDLVSRLPMTLNGSVTVTAPPDGPVGMAITMKGCPARKSGGSSSHAPQAGIYSSQPSNPSINSSVVGPDGLELEIGFSSPRDVHVGPLVVVRGDLVVFGGRCSDGTCGSVGGSAITVSGMDFGMTTSSHSGAVSSVRLLDVSAAGGDQVSVDVPPSTCLSSSHSSVVVPVAITRLDPTPMRAYSVTLHLSSNLYLSSAVQERSYLSSHGSTQMFVTDNGGNSYTIDVGILGPGCGATGDGTLFALPLSAVAPASDGTGTVTIDEVVARGCSNESIPSSPGADGFIPVNFSAPAAVSSLAATQVKTGNDGDGTTRVTVAYTLFDPDASSLDVEVYRAPFGNYPGYDNPPGGGSVPAIPSYPPPAPWTLTSVRSSGQSDEPPTRDFYYYVAFAKDLCGNVSSVSSMTGGTLNYHLCDVSNGSPPGCQGNNQVTTADMSLFGAHYGVTSASPSFLACLDFGPTTDRSVNGRPTTDNKIQFEDFVLCAINFSLVSAPEAPNRPAAAAMNGLRLLVPTLPAVGETFDAALELDGAGDAQALSVKLGYDPAVLEAVDVAAGALLGLQGRPSSVLSSEPGDVDAALLGIGPGIAGHGELARVTFRVKAAGEPRLAIASVTARDVSNREVAMTGATGPNAGVARTALGIAYPNPFDHSTTVLMSLRATGPASLGIFDVAGRRVRTLFHGMQAGGSRTVSWDGRDDAGARLGAGVYVMRLEAGGRVESRVVQLMK